MTDSRGRESAPPTYCGQPTAVEPVVSTSYRLVCPVHGVVAHSLSLKEATDHGGCKMPHSAPKSSQFGINDGTIG